jgi:lysophospholipase
MHIPLDIRRSHPPDAAFSEWCAPDGWLHRRMDWKQPAGRPARGKLLFAGGRGDFIEKYLEAYHHWHAAGWDVTAFDWRGQGASRGDPRPRLLSFDILIDDLSALIADWCGEDEGPHVAIAHSMGGHMLLRTIADRRPRLDAAVLIAPMLTVNSNPIPAWIAPQVTDLMCMMGWRAEPMWRQSKRPAPPGSARQLFLTGSAERYSDEAWWWEREPGFKVPAPSWGWIRAAYRSAASAFTPEKLGAIDTPLLIIGTDRDRLVSAAAIRRAARLMPRAELHMYADAAHEILREADPVRLDALARIDAFLDAHAERAKAA